jgi:predicted O-linked N-acetylglucosamine transferase (SPINDLY family)
LTELIADGTDGYRQIAVNLASDRERLSALRGNLRQRMATSPLCDAKAFAFAVEEAYRTMWRKSCES